MFLSPLSKTNLAGSFLGPLFCTICLPVNFYVKTKVFFFLITAAIYCNLRLGIVTLSTLFSFIMITSTFCGILWFRMKSGNRNFDRQCINSVYNFISIGTSTILILPICGQGISSVSSLFLVFEIIVVTVFHFFG